MASTAPTGPRTSWSYRPSLDGLRMLAMYVIVLFHTQVSWIKGGFIAVNLFFVLSGYLVTNVVLSEMDRTGRLDLGRFYARRVRRLLPAALVAIVGTCLVFVLVFPVVRRVGLIADAQSSLLYFANWRFIGQATDYFATDVEKSPFLHFWTLSIEEQFYIAFPLLLLFLARSTWRWAMFAGLSAVCLLSIGAQLYWAGVDPIHAYYGTEARVYQLAAGAVLAVGLRTWNPRMSALGARVLALGGFLAFTLLCFGFGGLSQSWHGIAGTVACVMLIAGLMMDESQLLGRVLAGRSSVYLGQISYATYLWHWPAILVLGQFFDVGPVLMAVLAAVIATAMASASGELLEMPVRTSKLLSRFRWRNVLVGVTASALVAVTLVPWTLEREREPALRTTSPATKPASASLPGEDVESPPEDIDWKTVQRDEAEEISCQRESVHRCIVHRGSGPHVLVVGDSHAIMLRRMFTKLAREHDFTLSMNTVPGCPWQENLKNIKSSPDREDRCTAARAGWYDKALPRLGPDLVIVAGLPREEGRWHRHLETRDGSDTPLKRSILRATRDTLAKIDKVAERTLMVQSIVSPMSFVPNDCLTTHDDPTRCVVPLNTRNKATDGFYLAATADNDTFYTVDLNPAFCPDDPLCAPVVNGQVVWRDRQHMTTRFPASRSSQVWKLIRETGFLKSANWS